MKYYVLQIWGDVDPSLIGPFPSEEARDQMAFQLKMEGGDDHGIFAIESQSEARVFSYSGAFFEEYDKVLIENALDTIAVLRDNLQDASLLDMVKLESIYDQLCEASTLLK